MPAQKSLWLSDLWFPTLQARKRSSTSSTRPLHTQARRSPRLRISRTCHDQSQDILHSGSCHFGTPLDFCWDHSGFAHLGVSFVRNRSFQNGFPLNPTQNRVPYPKSRATPVFLAGLPDTKARPDMFVSTWTKRMQHTFQGWGVEACEGRRPGL